MRISLDKGWRFYRGDIEIPRPFTHHECYITTKTERGLGPADPAWYDRDWETVDLPHDYQLFSVPDPAERDSCGFLPRENGWYRRGFVLSSEYENKRMLLVFGAAATHATVWVNGCLMVRNFCGYTHFSCDISPVVYLDGRVNVISVYIDTREIEGWYYEGTGLYRHVWLDVREPLAPELDGIYVKAVPGAGRDWNVSTEAEIFNAKYADATGNVCWEVLDGEKVLAHSVVPVQAAPRTTETVRGTMILPDPRIWWVDAPALYTLRTTVTAEGQQSDVTETIFGCRTITFDPNRGFFLNGRHIPLNGTANHQDFGPLGVAVPDNLHKLRITALKEMGCNAWRCAHNPPAPEFLDACDRLGMLVLDETRWFEATEDGLKQLEAMVRRDRNHPSVVVWSVGNEEPLQADARGRRIYKAMRQRVRQLDDRPVMLACNGGWLDDQVLRDLDIIGMNYSPDFYDIIHERYPNTPIIATETCAQTTLRGVYDSIDGVDSDSFDRHAASFGSTRRQSHSYIYPRPFIAGQFIWTGIDYRGECGWPQLFAAGGSVDPVCWRKDQFYLNKAQWTKEPMVHILPHWNGWKEGEEKEVWVYTNCEEAEMLLNGVSLGKKRPEGYDMPRWKVTYHPGELRALGYLKGVAVTEDIKATTGKPVALALELETGLAHTGGDVTLVTCFAVDREGREVPDAASVVYFSAENGEIKATFGSIWDASPVTDTARQMQAGRAMAFLMPRENGLMTLTAEAEGLEPATLVVPVFPGKEKPALAPVDYDYRVEQWFTTPIPLDECPDYRNAGKVQDENTFVAWRGEGESPFARKPGWVVYAAMPKQSKLRQLHCTSLTGKGVVIIHRKSGMTTASFEGRNVSVSLLSDAAPGEQVLIAVVLYGDSTDCGIHGKIHWTEENA
ncbi:MAG: glycoside hydrolase family 2 TIM barrel-domain containing protein [Christensenellales bacterium]|jgi:beta-galactosidase